MGEQIQKTKETKRLKEVKVAEDAKVDTPLAEEVKVDTTIAEEAEEISEELALYCAETVPNYAYIDQDGNIVTTDGKTVSMDSLDLSGFNSEDKVIEENIYAIEKVYVDAVANFKNLSHYKYGVNPARISEEGMKSHIDAIKTLQVSAALLGEEGAMLTEEDKDALYYEAATNKLLISICNKLVDLAENEKPSKTLLNKFKKIATRDKAITSHAELNDIYTQFGMDKMGV